MLPPDEDGISYAPPWLTWWGNIQSAVVMGAIMVYVWGYYSHAPRSKFGRVVSTLNVTFAAVTLVERLFIFFWNDACAFFFFETAYFACEYNLFHYRTAIFYQQNVTVYKWLVRICQFINLAMFYHNLVFAILGGRFYFIYMTCIGDVLLNTQATAVPVAVVSVSTILLAFYTIGKYWRQSGDTARRSMRILWLVLLNSVYNFASAMLNGTPVNASYGQQLTSYWLTVLNKVISLILAVMVHRRVRERETNKAFSKQQQAPASSATPNRKPNSATASVSHGPAKTSTPLVGGATSGQ